MLPTNEQSADLKRRFKDWLNKYGHEQKHPGDGPLLGLARRHPNEWSEACEEWESDLTTSHPSPGL